MFGALLANHMSDCDFATDLFFASLSVFRVSWKHTVRSRRAKGEVASDIGLCLHHRSSFTLTKGQLHGSA